MDFRFEVLLDVVFVTDSVVFATASELVLLLLLLTFSFFSGGCKDCIIVDGASLRIEMVEVDGSANFDSGGGRLQLEVVVDVEPEAEVDSPAAICGCITFDDKSHVKLVKSLSLSTSIVVFLVIDTICYFCFFVINGLLIDPGKRSKQT